MLAHLQAVVRWLVNSSLVQHLREPAKELAAHFLLTCLLLAFIKGLEIVVHLLLPGGKVFRSMVDVHDVLDTAHLSVLGTSLVFGTLRFIYISWRELRKP